MSLKKVIKYREVWMGLAILWVVLFHSGFEFSNEILNFIKKNGYAGVDIFLFASGIGCFYSLEKDSDSFNFIKRRIIRIIPTYWTFLVGWVIYNRIYSGISLRSILGNFLCIRNFTGLGGEFNWYISAMWLMYLLAPVFKGVVDRINSVYKLVLMTGMLVLFSMCFWDAYVYIVTVTRIPIFFIGMYFGKLAWNDVCFRKKDFGFLLAGVIMGFVLLLRWYGIHEEDMWYKGYHWYPFILITPGVCVFISWFMELIKNKAGGIIEKILLVPGKYSFEIYLIHIWFFDILRYNLVENGIVQESTMVWLITVAAIVPGCIVLHCAQKIVRRILDRIIEQKKTLIKM